MAWSATPSSRSIFSSIIGGTTARQDVGNPYDALLYAFYAIKVLPEEQRAVWRMVFDHYVFGANGDPAEHLPADARGLLGEIDSEQLARFRTTLRQLIQKL